MKIEQIKMNGVAFNRHFVHSSSLDNFVQWGLDHGIFRKHAQQIEMLSQVWALVHEQTNAQSSQNTQETQVKKLKKKTERTKPQKR